MKMAEKNEKVTVHELVSAVTPLLDGKGYSKKYIARIHKVFDNLMVFCETKGESHYSADLMWDFLREHYGFLPNSTTRNILRRAVNLLGDYRNFGTILRRTAIKREYPAGFQVHMEAFLPQYSDFELCATTVNRLQLSLIRLARFFESQGVLTAAEITMPHINSYTKERVVQLFKAFCFSRDENVEAVYEVPVRYGCSSRRFI
jgi:hypothetical protein